VGLRLESKKTSHRVRGTPHLGSRTTVVSRRTPAASPGAAGDFAGAHIYVTSLDGGVAKVIPHVKPDTHADDVLGALAAA